MWQESEKEVTSQRAQIEELVQMNQQLLEKTKYLNEQNEYLQMKLEEREEES